MSIKKENIIEDNDKIENLSIKLQLGDIIQLDAPSNMDLNEKIYFIKFINSKKIVLVNKDKIITLDISETGKLLEESIENILLLNRASNPSFTSQNKLEVNKYISLYFGDPLPKVVNGLITNIENDMIEITTIPEKNIIYIDFAYSGIPEELNIEKIIVKEKSSSINFDSFDEEINEETNEESEFIDLENDNEYDYDLKTYDKQEKLDEIILDSIDLGPELEDLEHVVNVSESEKRYSLDKQLNDHLDKLINQYLPEERNDEVINNINREINRFKELRNIYSNFDVNNNPSIIEATSEFYKPLKELLIKLNKKIYWILPVISNTKNIILNNNDDDDIDDELQDENINKKKQSEFVEELDKIIDNWLKNTSKEKVNNYKNYIENLLKIFDNFIVDNEEVLSVNNQIHIVNNLLDDFYSYTVKDEIVSKERFVIDVFNEGFKMLESYYFDNKKYYKMKELTENDNINIISFLTLPLPIFNFSKINFEYTNLYDKVHLNNNFISYYRILNSKTNVNKYILEESFLNDFIETHDNIHSDKISQHINNFLIDNTINLTYLEKLNHLMESFIPTTSVMIKIINNYILETNKTTIDTQETQEIKNIKNNDIFYNKNIYTINKILYNLQPLNTDIYNINKFHYDLLAKILNSNINIYKKNYKKNEEIFKKLILFVNNSVTSNTNTNTFDFTLLNSDLKNDVYNYYKLQDYNILNNNEFYNYCLKIDNAKFLLEAINKNIVDLIVSNLLENFINASNKGDKELKDELIKENIASNEKNCEKYVLSKKYNNNVEVEDDNNKLIYFDSIYDNTFYSIINEFKSEKDTMDDAQFFEFLTNKLIEKMNISKEEALRESRAIIEEKREVIDNDYALLVDKENNKNIILIRKNNTWISDEQFKDNFYIDSNKIFCDINMNCISDDNKCLSNEDMIKKNKKKEIDNILDNFKSQYNLSIEDIKGKINSNYKNSINYLNKIINIKKHKIFILNNLLLKYDNLNEDSILISPYENLKNYIIGLKDFALKQNYIKKFCLNYTRESISINDENPYWLYCIKTSVKLIPSFLLKLANAFIEKQDYGEILDIICADQGTISDDNNNWVDKYSGYVIKNIEFNTEEGYDEQGFKLQTRDILENEYTIHNDTNPKSSNPIVQMIINIIKSISYMMGINLVNSHEFIINNVISIQNSNIPSKKQYEELVLKISKKEGKAKQMPNYEDTYNSSLLLLTLTFILFSIQSNIPSIVSKKTFPGCIKSFKGYPLDGEQDKTSIIYISCIANKIKSSIKPWNSILKMSESSIAKKIEALIEKYILTNKEFDILLDKKREYLLHVKNEKIPESVSLNKWLTFSPPLIDFTINSNNLQSLGDGFKNTLLEDFSKGKKNIIKETLESKVIYYSNAIIEIIQNIVKKNSPLLQNSNNQAFLENSCCNTEKNAILFFYNIDKNINNYNINVKLFNNTIESINILNKSVIIYHPINNKNIIPKNDHNFNEEIIYKAFIHFCNFNNNIPINDELRGLCMDKPDDFDTNKPINENIEILKQQGKIYNLTSLTELINIINKENIIKLNNNYPIVNNLEFLRDLLENFLDNYDDRKNSDKLFFDKLFTLLDTFDIRNDDNDNLRTLNNHMGKLNILMKGQIIEFIKKQSYLSKQNYNSFIKNLDIEVDINNTLFYYNYLINLIYIFPNIIKNNNINYNAIPKHWNLSEIHNNDIANIIRKYYNTLNNFSTLPELEIVFKVIQNKSTIFLNLIKHIFYIKPIVIGNTKENINSIFNENFIKLLYNYILYTLINDIINIEKDYFFNLEIVNYPDFDYNLMIQKLVEYLIEFLNIMNNHNNLLNNNYKKVKEKISYAKEKEKDLITEYLKDLTDEEREIENIFKNNKLEKWSKGLQKGLTQYVKENYDEERNELEKQALKEKKLQNNNNVTDMNKEIYNLDIENEEAMNDEIEKEEYDMGNIPDDDDFDSDYEYN